MMRLTFSPRLSLDQRLEWNAFIDDALSGTPYQLAEFYDWWYCLGPIDSSKSGFFVGERDGKICFCALGFYKQLTDGHYAYEFEHGPVAQNLPDLLEGLALLREYINPLTPILMGPHLLYDPALERTFCEMGYARSNRRWYDASVIIDLTKSEEQIFASFTGAARGPIRKAEREKHVVTLEDSEEACQLYTKLHNDLSRQRGFMAIHPNYVYRIIKSDNRGKLFFLRDAENQILAGAVLICTRKLAWYHLGASIKDKPVGAQFLHWKIIHWCKGNAILFYELGGIDSGQPQHTVNRFKLSMARNRRPVPLLPLFYHSTESLNTERGYLPSTEIH